MTFISEVEGDELLGGFNIKQVSIGGSVAGNHVVRVAANEVDAGGHSFLYRKQSQLKWQSRRKSEEWIHKPSSTW